jgi:hypothetical protein
MAEGNTTRAFLRTRERELNEALASLLAERKEIRTLMAAIGMEPEIDKDTEIAPVRDAAEEYDDDQRQGVVDELMRTRPVKALILEAMKEIFPNGVTSPELQVLLNKKWDRGLSGAAVSVYLSDLKSHGKLVLNGRRWYLADEGEREKMNP